MAARTAITDRRYAISTNTAQFTIAKLDRQGAEMRCLILPLTLEGLPKLTILFRTLATNCDFSKGNRTKTVHIDI